MRPTVTIVAVDHQTREHWAQMLEEGGFDAVASAADPLDLPDTADATVLWCPSSDPGPILAAASLALPGSRHVVVMPVITRHAVRRAVRGGAAGVVRELDAERSLALVVHGACAGQLSIPLDFAGGLEKPILSAREKQILGLVVVGYTNGQVARRLFLAESTVKSHMSSIFGKLDVCSRKEAAAAVLDPDEGLGLGLGILSVADAAAPSAIERAQSAA